MLGFALYQDKQSNGLIVRCVCCAQVMSQYEELPQELLDMVLQGINAPRTLSLDALEAAVADALQG